MTLFAARWEQNGVTVAGGKGAGYATNQLNCPYGLAVDDNDTVVVADHSNHRIVEWKKGDTAGRVVAGGNGQGGGMNQLHGPTDVIIDKETDSLIICDWLNSRVMRWSRRQGTTSGEVLIDNIRCWGITMDDERNLYVTDTRKHEVRRFSVGDKVGTVVAGGNGEGAALNQLNDPSYVFVDREKTVYVSDKDNHRVVKWMKGATTGVVVAGGRGEGSDLSQLSNPVGLFVDEEATVYVAEYVNHRVTRWPKGAQRGTVVVGGNGQGSAPN